MANNNNKENNNIYNKNIYNKKKRVCTTTNKTTYYYNYYKLLNNRYYKGIIYLLLTKGYTYIGEIQKIYPISARQYLLNMKEKNVIRKKTMTKEIKDFIKHSNVTINEKQINTMTLYSLTPHAKNFFLQEDIYDDIIQDMDEELTYYEQLLEKYKSRLDYLEKKQRDEEHRFQLRMKSLGLSIVKEGEK